MTTPTVLLQLAENITKYRKKLGITQAQLAEKISVEKETISRMESGKITPSLARLERLASALECPIADLLRNTAPDVRAQAEAVADMIHALPHDEREAVVSFVRDAVRLFRRMR